MPELRMDPMMIAYLARVAERGGRANDLRWAMEEIVRRAMELDPDPIVMPMRDEPAAPTQMDEVTAFLTRWAAEQGRPDGLRWAFEDVLLRVARATPDTRALLLAEPAKPPAEKKAR